MLSEDGSMLTRLLFETKAGERFLTWLERRLGLAIVLADSLARATA